MWIHFVRTGHTHHTLEEMDLVTVMIVGKGKTRCFYLSDEGVDVPGILDTRKQIYHALLCSAYQGRGATCIPYETSDEYKALDCVAGFDKQENGNGHLTLTSPNWRDSELKQLADFKKYKKLWFFQKNNKVHARNVVEMMENYTTVDHDEEDEDLEFMSFDGDGSLATWTNPDRARLMAAYTNIVNVPYVGIGSTEEVREFVKSRQQ